MGVGDERVTAEELDRLSQEWTARLEENLEHAEFSADELIALAGRHRALARVAESPGQRRAALAIAGRYEAAAHMRAGARG